MKTNFPIICSLEIYEMMVNFLSNFSWITKNLHCLRSYTYMFGCTKPSCNRDTLFHLEILTMDPTKPYNDINLLVYIVGNELLFLVVHSSIQQKIKRIVYKSFFMNDKLILDNIKEEKHFACLLSTRSETFLSTLKAQMLHSLVYIRH